MQPGPYNMPLQVHIKTTLVSRRLRWSRALDMAFSKAILIPVLKPKRGWLPRAL